MQIVHTAELKPGQTLRRAIYSRYGQRLVAPGVTLTPEILTALEARGGGLYVDEAERRALTQAASLLRTPAAGNKPRPRAFEALLPSRTTPRHTTPAARLRRDADDIVAARLPRWDGAPRRVQPAPDALPLADAAFADLDHAPALLALNTQRLRAVESLTDRLVELEARSADLLAEEAVDLVDELTDQVSRHAPMYPHIVEADPAPPRALAAQMLATSSLAIAMAARLGWSRADVAAAGLAGLFADAGMALVDEDIRASDRPLDDLARNRIRRHPTWSAALLEQMKDLPLPVRLGVHQHHEREDGSGYPRGLRAGAIHDIARLVGIADAYAAAVSHRPYRSRATRFAVMRALVEDARRARLWRDAVRALIQTVGLFPVGSFVRLSDGRIGQVAAAGGRARAARPIIQLWRAGSAGHPEPADLVDLAARPWAHLRIVADIDSPGLLARAGAARLAA